MDARIALRARSVGNDLSHQQISKINGHCASFSVKVAELIILSDALKSERDEVASFHTAMPVEPWIVVVRCSVNFDIR
jgi:hypothetical protein